MTHVPVKAVILISTCCLVLLEVSPVATLRSMRQERRYCGSYLVDMLSFVCEGRYNTMRKRYDPDTDELTPKWLSLENLPFLSKQNALSMLVKRAGFLRKSRGIVEECCKKSCSFDVLNSYCLPKTTRRPDFLSTTQRYERSPPQQADY